LLGRFRTASLLSQFPCVHPAASKTGVIVSKRWYVSGSLRITVASNRVPA
jgi:hypothetical protein